MKKEIIKSNKAYYLCGFIVMAVTSVILLCVSAFIIVTADLAKNTVYPLSSVCLGVGNLCGAYFIGSKVKEKGIIIGICISFVTMLICFILSTVLNGFNISWLFAIKYLIIGIMAVIGGILGVNKNNSSFLVK